MSSVNPYLSAMKTTDSSNLSFDDAVIQAKKELGGARVYLSLALPFFSSLFSHLKVYFSDKLPTAGVSADDRLFINPHFFIGLPNVNQRAFLLAHEVLHPALGYFFRSRMMIPGLANIAHDHIINLILAGENSEWFIEGGYKDEKYKGWAFEQIYADLLTQHAKQPQRSGAGDGAGEDGEGQGEANKPAKRGKAGQGGKPGKGKSDGVGGAIGKDTLTVEEANKILGIEAQPGAAGQMESEKKQREWNHRLLHAAITARSQGKGSAGIDRLVETMHDSTVPWTEVLKLAVSEAHTRSRIDWSYPSRRTESLGLDHWPREEYLGFEAAVYPERRS